MKLLNQIFRHKDIPYPPQEFIDSIGGGTAEQYKQIGDGFVQHFRTLAHLAPNDSVLDIGCGCGRIATPLSEYLTGKYEGFDISNKQINWANENIAKYHKNFKFHYADIYNKYYNPTGKIKASEFKFPYPAKSFDFIYLTSVFTHMLPEDMKNYFSNISRVLKPGGKCLITYFLINKESLNNIVLKKSAYDFFKFDEYYITNKDNPESAIAYSEDYIRELYYKNNMKLVEPIHYGGWCGRTKWLDWQDIVVAAKI